MQRHVGEAPKQIAQPVLQTAVDLDHVHVRRDRRQALGQHSLAAPDLEHDVAWTQLGEALDHVEDVAVDEEVLTERARPARSYHPNTAAALRSTAASSSSYATRRSTASAWAVCTT